MFSMTVARVVPVETLRELVEARSTGLRKCRCVPEMVDAVACRSARADPDVLKCADPTATRRDTTSSPRQLSAPARFSMWLAPGESNAARPRCRPEESGR